METKKKVLIDPWHELKQNAIAFVSNGKIISEIPLLDGVVMEVSDLKNFGIFWVRRVIGIYKGYYLTEDCKFKYARPFIDKYND